MSDQMQGGMAEAMRLMQEGDLTGATTVIQRSLGGSSFGTGFAPVASPDAPDGAGEPIDVESIVVDNDPRPEAASRPNEAREPAAAERSAASRFISSSPTCLTSLLVSRAANESALFTSTAIFGS